MIASSHNDEQVGWNEKSFRYVAIEDGQEFYCPQTFRQQAKVNKQATEGALDPDVNRQAVETYETLCQQSYQAYRHLLDLGVGREQARGVLVPAVYTSWVWTVSLQALLHFLQLRLGKGAQNEITAYARAAHELVSPIVPHSITAWEKSLGLDLSAAGKN
ncbi:MAG: FAD-dependent thymidylate synthase [Elainellaceae cyanobacterium]